MAEPIPLHGTSLHDGVAAGLRHLVFARQITPGSYIDELTLAAQWQISRTPLGKALHDGLERHAGARDVDGHYRVNHAFCSRVQALAANRWLDRATGDLRRFTRLWRDRQLKLPGRIEASIKEHRVLLDAMLQRDARRAERARHDHLVAQLVALKAQQRVEAQRHHA